MSKENKNEEKTLIALVSEWVNLDNPERIEESVRKWTSNGHKNGNSSEQEYASNKYISILTRPYSRR